MIWKTFKIIVKLCVVENFADFVSISFNMHVFSRFLIEGFS